MEIEKRIVNIVLDAQKLKDTHTNEKDALVNYACVFAQSEQEFSQLLEQPKSMGEIIKETPTGPLFKIEPMQTSAGMLKLVKIRKPDPTRPERGDADFTVSDYPAFKQTVLGTDGFKLIERENFEMIELMDPAYDVRAYFSNPPLDKQLGIS
jgi:hypothetical protein